MAVKILEVFVCDCGCGEMHQFGQLPESWVWGMETIVTKRPNPTRRTEMIEDTKKAERQFAGEACVKRYEKAHQTKIARPVVNESAKL